MQYLPQIGFLILAIAGSYFFAKKALEIKRNIMLGKAEDLSDQPGKRWNNLILLALGQKKMFKNPLVAIMHLIIYAGFIIINLEVLEIVLDGLTGNHRLFAPILGNLYPLFINFFEWLAVGVILVCIVFLIRRNIIKLKRFIHKIQEGKSTGQKSCVEKLNHISNWIFCVHFN